MDSLERALDALLALEGASQDASREACASLEDGVSVEGPSNAEGVVREAPSEIAVGPSFSARIANASPCRPKLPNQLMLGTYVLLHEWDRLSVYMVAPSPEAALEIIYCYNPFNERESSVAYMSDLCPTLLRVPVVARVEEYSIPFLGYLDRKSFQHVAEDGMLIHNHDFNESTELVCFDF